MIITYTFTFLKQRLIENDEDTNFEGRYRFTFLYFSYLFEASINSRRVKCLARFTVPRNRKLQTTSICFKVTKQIRTQSSITTFDLISKAIPEESHKRISKNFMVLPKPNPTHYMTMIRAIR